MVFKELEENGFQKTGEWNGRYYYSKCGFEVVEHYGVFRCNKNNWSGYGREFKTIDELNEAIRKSLIKKINTAEKRISIYNERLIELREYLKQFENTNEIS